MPAEASIRRSPCKGKRKGSSVSATSLILFTHQGHCLLQRADVLPHFPAFRMHIFGFPVLAAGNLRQDSHALRLDHRLMEEISKFFAASAVLSGPRFLSRESKRILPRSKSLLNFDASSPSVCGACSIWVITACWICANSSGFIARNFASAVGKNAL